MRREITRIWAAEGDFGVSLGSGWGAGEEEERDDVLVSDDLCGGGVTDADGA